MTKVSVCLPTTRLDTVADAIASITRQTWPDWELLVVTQNAGAALVELVAQAEAADDRIRHVPLEERGLSLARNAGVREARGEIVAMIDDDAEAAHDWLATIVDCFDADADLGLVGGAVIAPPGVSGNCPTNMPPELRYVGRPGVHAPEGWDWIGCNFAFRRELIDRMGGFDEQLGAGSSFPGMEDTDFKLRLECAGVPMLTTPRSIVVHTHGVRRGLKPRLRHQRNYALGNGAMAAKLAGQGDPRGPAWMRSERRACLIGWLAAGKVYKAPSEWRRLWYFMQGYRSYLRQSGSDASQAARPQQAHP